MKSWSSKTSLKVSSTVSVFVIHSPSSFISDFSTTTPVWSSLVSKPDVYCYKKRFCDWIDSRITFALSAICKFNSIQSEIIEMDLAREYIAKNLTCLRGMISNDANHLTLLYFLISSAKLLKMTIPSDTVTTWVLK